MKPNLLVAIILPFLSLWYPAGRITHQATLNPEGPDRVFAGDNPYRTIGTIPLPAGYSRVALDSESFGQWLRNFPLKKNKFVYLYDGSLKKNQAAQFAVLDISVGNQDLQQCADAVMRIKAEYLYAKKRFDEICFADNSHNRYVLGPARDRAHFKRYLDRVFVHCGTLSLEKQLHPVTSLNHLLPGDVLIQGGSPGHAMLVVDMAVCLATGKKIFLLAQSYMPAQDVHIVINPGRPGDSPWYDLEKGKIITPEWNFNGGQFRTW